MNEKNVEVLALLLKKPSDQVTKALETEGGLETMVSDFKINNQVFGLDDFAKLKVNLKKETIDHLEEADIPDSYKNKAVGWKLGQKEEEIATKYQFTDDFNGLTDLVDKIVTKSKTPNDNEDEVAALKTRIVEIEGDFNTKLAEKQNEFDSSIIKSDFDKAMKAIGLDYEDKQLEKQKGLLRAAFNDVFKTKRQDGITVVLKGEDIVKDTKFDPQPLKEVLLGIAKDYGFQLKSPDPGGHGGRSSQKKTGLTGVSWDEYLAKNNVSPNTEAADKLYTEWKAANKN